jgi:transcriptional regulator with XRE-family HTH domain
MAKKMIPTPAPMPRPLRKPLKIRAWRKHRHMTLEQLASKVSLTPSALSMLERGQRGYNQDTLEAIAAELQTDVPSLFILDPGKPEAIWQWLASIGQKGTFTSD